MALKIVDTNEAKPTNPDRVDWEQVFKLLSEATSAAKAACYNVAEFPIEADDMELACGAHHSCRTDLEKVLDLLNVGR